jgi:hypothetical protein
MLQNTPTSKNPPGNTQPGKTSPSKLKFLKLLPLLAMTLFTRVMSADGQTFDPTILRDLTGTWEGT